MHQLLENATAERVSSLLSAYSCPKNHDIENYLKNNAIDFSKQGIAQTHLIIMDINGTPQIIAYFALANKVMSIPRFLLSKTYEKRIGKFALLENDKESYVVPMPLIAQLGKNYSDGLDSNISGQELLKIACDKVKAIQHDLGGRFVYLECEHDSFLMDFYHANGFRQVSDQECQDSLIQFIKYL